MQDTYAFTLIIKDFISMDISRILESKFNVVVTNNQNLFSKFIRYWVFNKFFGVSYPNFLLDNNKPFLENHQDFKFNISHSADRVIIVVSGDEVGVDVENIKKKNFLGIASRYFSKMEYQMLKESPDLAKDFYTLWTLKEAQVKRNGLGIAYGFSQARFVKNKDDCWYSISCPNDFLTFGESNLISICIKNIVHKNIKFFNITKNLSFERYFF